ncbi:probable anion transporter 6 [Trichogramma pretiosum]|uniref:probable anion transporter 6 n=1 Tax=Trichogramma pretiosum TaxID=7493 RepID=UPI0006C986B4|nr:probable anion transporter 6 [Trichogramma pretiosum]
MDQRVVYQVKEGKRFYHNSPALQLGLITIAVWYFYHTTNFHYGLLFTGSQSNDTQVVKNEAHNFYHYSATYVLALPIAAALATTYQSAKSMLNFAMGCNVLMHLAWIVCDAKELDEKFPADRAYFWRALWHTLFGVFTAPVLPCVYQLLGRSVPQNYRASVGSLVLNVRWLGMLTAFFVVFMDETVGPAYSVYAYNGIYGFVAAWLALYWLLGADYEVEIVEPRSQPLTTMGPRVPWRAMLTSTPVIALIMSHSAYYFTHMLGLHSKELIVLGTGQGTGSSRPTVTVLWSLLIGTSSGALSDVLVELGFLTTSRARKLFNFVGTCVPMAVAGIYFKIMQYQGETSYDASWQYLSVIVAALSSLQTSGFLINHMDLSPYFAGVLIAVTEAANHIMTVFTIIAMSHWDVNVFKDYISLWLNDEGLLNWIFLGLFCFWSSAIFMFFGQTSIQKWSPVPMSFYRNINKLRTDL